MMELTLRITQDRRVQGPRDQRLGNRPYFFSTMTGFLGGKRGDRLKIKFDSNDYGDYRIKYRVGYPRRLTIRLIR
jgi:hypothetical protein